MAYVQGKPGQKEEEELNKEQSFTSRGSVGTQEVAPEEAGSPQFSNPQNNQKNFAGIQDYVKANQGKATGLANQLASGVKQAGQNARSTLNTSVKSFNKDVDKNTVGVNQQVLDKASKDPTSVGKPDPFANVAPVPQSSLIGGTSSSFGRNRPNANPNLYKAPKVEVPQDIFDLYNQDDFNEFVKMRDAEYGGPDSLEASEYAQPAEQAYETAQTASENARTEQGNRNLLDDLQTKQLGYTNQGSLLLNNALLRSDLGARQILQDAAASNANLGDLFKGAQTASLSRADSGRAITDATRQKIQDTFGGRQGDMEKKLSERTQVAIRDAETKAQTITNAILSGATPTDEQLAELGVTPGEWHKLQDEIMLYNLEYGQYSPNPHQLKNYIQQQLPQLNPQNIATDAEYAEYEALNRLMGTDNQFLSDPSLAGTGSTDIIDFDIDQALADMANLDRTKVKPQETAKPGPVPTNGRNAAGSSEPTNRGTKARGFKKYQEEAENNTQPAKTAPRSRGRARG